jgi:hypothetical protein
MTSSFLRDHILDFRSALIAPYRIELRRCEAKDCLCFVQRWPGAAQYLSRFPQVKIGGKGWRGASALSAGEMSSLMSVCEA